MSTELGFQVLVEKYTFPDSTVKFMYVLKNHHVAYLGLVGMFKYLSM